MANACLHGQKSGNRKIAARIRALATAGAMLAATAAPALAEHTRWWRQDTFEDFDKGTPKGVALRSDGKLFLAPRFTEFADMNLAYLLALHADGKGNLYAAGGSNAKVVRVDAGGKASTVFESQELAAQALAMDAAGNLFVGTSPDGKVYKVTPGGQSSVFFDPKTKYIWDLAVDKDGTVYVATGDTGKIFSVASDGKGQVFYSSGETHIRTLALDAKGNVLAGTEPSGRVLRISKGASPRAFVLYETSKREITALLGDAAGNLYVSAVGEKTAAAPLPARPQVTDTQPTQTFTMTVVPGGAKTPPQAQPAGFTPFPAVNSSSVYKISADGSPDELWSSRDQVVYALALLPNGKLIFGTGNDGAVVELEGNHIYSRLVKAVSRQITGIVAGPGGKMFLAAANPGKVFSLGPDNEPEGTFESQPFDAHIFSRWGRLQWWGGNAAGGKGGARVEFFARSGNTSNPESDWSAWSGPYTSMSADKADCPAGRFVQWKAELHGGAAGSAPEVDWVSLAYLPKNVAPDVTAIALQAPGVRVQNTAMAVPGASAGAPVQLRMPQAPGPASSGNPGFNAAQTALAMSAATPTHFDPAPQGSGQKGYQSVLWTAEDANDDTLEYAIYFRGENESNWKLLKDHLDSKFYSWDTTTMPDGAYYLKIVASDGPGNPSGEGLAAERESERFVVDNTPPAISQLTGEAAGAGTVRVKFQANASGSFVTRAQYSVDAGDWMLVSPAGGLSDQAREDYDFTVPKLAAGEHTVTVRVFDQFDNTSSSKATIRVPAGGN
jgi:hypothetical protein